MELQLRANQCIAQGSLTNSRHPRSFVKGVYPTHITNSQGCHVWGNDNKKYIDFICGLGTNLLGYGNPIVANEIGKYLHHGYCPSLGTQHEIEAAETLKELVPFIERVKWVKTGSEACSAAVKFARAFTGRNWVLSQGYHGWHQEFNSLIPPAKGCVKAKNIFNFEYTKIDRQTAAVIIEPVNLDWSEETKYHLKTIRKRCYETGTLLIFDEVITGARFKKFCVANYYDIQPDLIIFGKAIGNGLPIACVAGRKDILDNQEVFVSSTYGPEILSLISTKTVLKTIMKKPDYSIKNLWMVGKEFYDNFNKLHPNSIQLTGYPTRGVFTGNDNAIALLFQEACHAGILFGKSWFISYPHIEYMKQVFDIVGNIVRQIKLGKIKLEGDKPTSPFSFKARE